MDELKTIEAKIGFAQDCGYFVIPDAYGDLTGTIAKFRIGSLSADGSGIKLQLSSNVATGNQSIINWDVPTRKLTIDICQEDILLIGPGLWFYQPEIIKSSQRLYGGRGDFIVRKAV